MGWPYVKNKSQGWLDIIQRLMFILGFLMINGSVIDNFHNGKCFSKRNEHKPSGYEIKEKKDPINQLIQLNFFNRLEPTGTALHNPLLKIRVAIMLLYNLNPPKCFNGKRLII